MLTSVEVGRGGVAPEVEVAEPVPKVHHLGLDWFVLDLFLLALVFVPLERAFGRAPGQPALRKGWRTDTAHFFVSHVGIDLLTFLTVAPAVLLSGVLPLPGLRAAVGGLPFAMQLKSERSAGFPVTG